ncbi:MAG: proline dehydrogenase family protein [Methanoregulaceae archaeon]|nr:proline dehydrogenase family protein [Methanoregulaceae archaeon]
MTDIVERENRWALPDLDRALSWCSERNRQKIACTLHVLDEFTRTREEVDTITAAYRETINGISTQGLDAAIPIKLSSLGALFDGDLTLERTYDLCREANTSGVGFEIDMEGRDLVGAAIEAAALCGRKNLPVTLALQAYLYRTPGDLRLLLALGVVPRFVKGAYLGDMEDFPEIQTRLLDLVREAARFEVSFHVGTHDPELLPEIRSLMEDHRDRITFGFLMGLADRTKQEMAADGWKVSEYVPFGKDAGPYVARRERYLRELENAGRTAVE